MNLPQQPHMGESRRLALIFHLAWITAVAVIILLMRVLVDSSEVVQDLSELEEAETISVSLDGAFPPTLEPLAGPVPGDLVSSRVYVPLYRTLYVGEERAVNKLSATLSIYNTSPDHAVILNKVT